MGSDDLYPGAGTGGRPATGGLPWVRSIAILLVLILLLMVFRSLIFYPISIDGDCYPAGVSRHDPDRFRDVGLDDQGNIYVGDRGNARVKVYDSDLQLLRTFENVGNPWEICISPGPHQYLFVSNSNPDSNPAESWDITGEIYKMELDGTIIGRFGEAGKEPGQFQTIHGMDCRNPNEILVSEISAWRVQKIRVGSTPVS